MPRPAPHSVTTFVTVAALLLCGGCADEMAVDSAPADQALAVAPDLGELLIEELYYSGAAPAGGADHYFSDQFVKLVNATEHPLDLSGVMVADVYGSAGAINPGTLPDSYRQEHPDHVVLSSVWRLPQGVTLEPGAHLIIAQDGANHRPFSSVDLSGASFETYVASSGGDHDHPTSPNLEQVVFNGGNDWLVPVFGPSIVVLAADAALGTQSSPIGALAMAPNESVLDAIECLMDANAGAFKRLADSVQTGHAFVSGIYVGESLLRRNSDGVWQDTNDSAADFMIGTPDSSSTVTSEGVHGDPFVELGGGRDAFEALPDGADIELVAGIQGGWHLDVALRFGGIGPNGIVLLYDAVDAQANPLSFTTKAAVTSASVLPDGEAWQRVGDRIVLDITDASDVIGSTVILRVTVQLDGHTWSDELEVVIVDGF